MIENCSLIIDNLIEQRHLKGITQKELAKAALHDTIRYSSFRK